MDRFNKWLQNVLCSLRAEFPPRRLAIIALGTAIATFGLHNIHQRTGITEGGVLGLLLFVNHWTGLPASLVSPVLDLLCYAAALKVLGAGFLRTAVVSSAFMAAWFKVWESFPPMLPDLSPYPLAAAVLGGIFIGVGVGLIIRQGGSSGGDDALALVINRLSGWGLARCYLLTDLTVLALSLSYIPAWRIAFSLITVTLSSFLIEKVQNFHRKVPAE